MTYFRPKHDSLVVYAAGIGKHLEKFKRLIGKKIRERRIELGFVNQDDFAHAVDPELNQETVSKWERGINLPQAKYHEKLYKTLKTDSSLLDIDPKDFDRSEHLESILSGLSALNNNQLRILSFVVSRFPTLGPVDFATVERRLREFLKNNNKEKGQGT